MTLIDYTPPVSQLLSLGDVHNEDLLDYLALGLGPEHVPELCRMVLDRDLWWADSESVEVWSAIHAWRALAQIGSPEAIDALMELMGRIDEYDDDWTMTELPGVFAAIGPVAIPHLAAFLDDRKQGMWARICCVECFQKMAGKHPETLDECTASIMRQLKRFERQDETLNAFLISALIDFRAVEAAPLMEHAFAANKVDWSVAGDWEEVQVEMGLLEKRTTPKPHFHWDSPHTSTPGPVSPPSSSTNRTVVTAEDRRKQRQSKSKAKKKRKQQKQSRRKQRK